MAQLIGTLGCFVYAFARYPELRLHREDWLIARRDIQRHLIQGIPLGLQFSVLSIGIIVMQSVMAQLIGTLGGEMVSNAAQNGFGAANKLNNLLMTPLNGLGAAMTSFTAQNLGAGNPARIKKGTLQALGIVWTMCLLSIGIGLLLARGSVCLLLPPIFAGGTVSAAAPASAVYAFCFADPVAWIAADLVLLAPFFRNILRQDYAYLHNGRQQHSGRE